MISDLAHVPKRWEKVRFGEFVKNITNRVENPKESGLENYIGLEHLDTDEIRIKRYGSPTEVEATKFLCRKGDIIFGKRRAYLRKLAVSKRDAVVSAHSMVLRANEGRATSDFLPWFMQSSLFWKTAFAISEGSLSPTIKWKTLAEQEFWLPSIPEQKIIAKILWSIEDNLEKTENLIQVAEKLKSGLLEELLTKGIGHVNSKQTVLGEIPEEWSIIKMADAADIRGRVGWRGYKTSDLRDQGPLVIGAENIDCSNELDLTCPTYISEEKYNESPEIQVKKGDILIVQRGSIGKVVRIDNEIDRATINPSIILLTDLKVQSKYLYYFFISNIGQTQIRQSTSATGVPMISQGQVKNFILPLPSEDEQIKIINRLDAFFTHIFYLKQHYGNLKGLVKKLSDSFIDGTISFEENQN